MIPKNWYKQLNNELLKSNSATNTDESSSDAVSEIIGEGLRRKSYEKDLCYPTSLRRGSQDRLQIDVREFTSRTPANGGLLHTPEWGPDGNAPPGHSIDAVKNNYVKSNDVYDVVTENNIKYYHSNKLINEWELKNGVFDWGLLRPFTWNIKVE